MQPSSRPTLLTHTNTHWNTLGLKMPSSSSPPLFLSPVWKVLGKKKSTRSILRIWLVIRATPRWTTEAAGRESELWMVVFFSEVSPAPISLEERGECHCYGNLIYHKRIAFVTWPYSNGRAARPTHTQRKGKQGSGERRMKKKKSNSGQRKGCLSFASTFHLWRGLTKGAWLALLVCSPGNFQNGFRAKNKSTGKTWKTTPPFITVR